MQDDYQFTPEGQARMRGREEGIEEGKASIGAEIDAAASRGYENGRRNGRISMRTEIANDIEACAIATKPIDSSAAARLFALAASIRLRK